MLRKCILTFLVLKFIFTHISFQQMSVVCMIVINYGTSHLQKIKRSLHHFLRGKDQEMLIPVRSFRGSIQIHVTAATSEDNKTECLHFLLFFETVQPRNTQQKIQLCGTYNNMAISRNKKKGKEIDPPLLQTKDVRVIQMMGQNALVFLHLYWSYQRTFFVLLSQR